MAAYGQALVEARTRAQTLANEMRAKAAADGEARRKEVDAKLGARIAEAEKAITRGPIGGDDKRARYCRGGRPCHC